MYSVLRYDGRGGRALCNVDAWNSHTREWEECDRYAYSVGLCGAHYQRFRSVGTRINNFGTRKLPEYEREGELPYGIRLGWEEPREPNVTGASVHWCQYPNCQLPSPAGTGLCERHSMEWQERVWNSAPVPLEDPQPVPRVGRPVSTRTCTLCDRKHYAKGYCRNHYMQQHSVNPHVDNDDLAKYIRAVHPPDGNYSELDGCGLDEPYA
jgi:hypothetical protein